MARLAALDQQRGSEGESLEFGALHFCDFCISLAWLFAVPCEADLLVSHALVSEFSPYEKGIML